MGNKKQIRVREASKNANAKRANTQVRHEEIREREARKTQAKMRVKGKRERKKEVSKKLAKIFGIFSKVAGNAIKDAGVASNVAGIDARRWRAKLLIALLNAKASSDIILFWVSGKLGSN